MGIPEQPSSPSTVHGQPHPRIARYAAHVALHFDFADDACLAAVELLVGNFRLELEFARKAKSQRSSGSGPPIVV